MPELPLTPLPPGASGTDPPEWDALRRALAGLTGDALLARLRRDQQKRWRAGALPPAEDYLAAFPALADDPELTLTLIYAEALLRGATGSSPDLTEYRRRFPALADRLALVFQFDAALDDDPGLGVAPVGPADDDLVPGYELLGEVGRGGMAVVFKARDRRLNRTVALKLVPVGALTSPERVARFRQEAELAARVSHPNIVQVFEAGEAAGYAYLTMEFVDGPSLAQSVAGTPQPPDRSAALVETLAAAAHAAHLRGIVHRDLKPANILLAGSREQAAGSREERAAGSSSSLLPAACSLLPAPKIADFGLARALDTASDLTATGAVVGTPCYMAPEQAAGSGESVGPAADVYALGAILYELLTGQPPFRAATRSATLAMVLRDEPLPPRRLRPAVPRELETICLKCLRKDPGRRYATAADLADDLRRFRAGEPIRARPVGAVGRAWRWCRRNPGWAVALGATAALLLVIAGGASVGVVRLRAALTESERHRARAEAARAEADSRRLEALLAQAESLRTGSRPGQRFRTLRVLADAADQAAQLGSPPTTRQEIRNQVAAALALPDLWVGRWWTGFPPGSARVDINADFDTYARTDVRGGCTVRRVADDAVVCDLPAPPGPLPRGALYPVLSPDGRFLLAFWIDAGLVTGWDLAGGPRERFAAEGVYRFDFSPDGRRVALSHYDGTLAVYDLPAGRLLHRHPPADVPAGPVAWHPRQPLVAAGSPSAQTVLVRDAQSGAVRATAKFPDHCIDVAWLPDGLSLAVLDRRGVLHLCDAADLKERRRVPLGPTAAMVSFAPGGDLAAVNTTAAEMILLDVTTGREVFRHPPAHTPVLRPRFSRDGRRLAVVAEGGRLGLWDVADGRECRVLPPGPPKDRQVYGLAAHPTDPRLVAVAGSNGLSFWDVEAGVEVAAARGPVVGRVAFEPAGHLVYTGPDGTFRRTARATDGGIRFGPPEKLPLPPGNDLTVSRDGRVVVTATAYPEVPREQHGTWVRVGTDPPFAVGPGDDPRFAAVSADGRWVATGREKMGEIKLWRVADGAFVRRLTTWGTHPRFSPDGRWLAVGGDSGRLYRVGSWEEGAAFQGVGCFSPDGKFLSAMSMAGDCQFLDVATGRELVRVAPPSVEARQVLQTFTADGARLVGVDDGERSDLRVWDLRRLRTGLAERGLDWDAAPLPAATPQPPLRVTLEPAAP
jgi:WD40 repeat protein